MKNIVILVSGRGSNMEAIIHALKAGGWNARVAAVISNTPVAAGLVTAAQEGIETRVVPSADFGSRDAYDAALAEVIDHYAPDVVVLAGFMRILTAGFVDRYKGRMVNIHPSLLPAFTGLHTHRRAIEAGVRVHGATVHFVTPELDAGPIIAQAAVPVFQDDTEASLGARVLQQEHILYPRVVRWLVDGHVRLENDRVVLDEAVNHSHCYIFAGGIS